MSEITRIQATKKLTKKLKGMGKKGESYEDIIWKLIEYYEEEEQTDNDEG